MEWIEKKKAFNWCNISLLAHISRRLDSLYIYSIIVPWHTNTASGVGPPGPNAHLDPNTHLEAIQHYCSTPTMNSSYIAIEQRIQAACEAARCRKDAKITSLAREFDVPMTRLRARLHGRSSRSQRTITTKRLDPSQEAALISWINILNSLHVPPTARMVDASANAMIERDGGAPVNKTWVDLGKDWVRS